MRKFNMSVSRLLMLSLISSMLLPAGSVIAADEQLYEAWEENITETVDFGGDIDISEEESVVSEAEVYGNEAYDSGGTVIAAEAKAQVSSDTVSAQVALRNPEIILNRKMAVWDGVYFGRYLQRDTNGDKAINEKDESEPILWRVLQKDDDSMLLLANDCLDSVPIHLKTQKKVNSYELTTVRSWLNGYSVSTNTVSADQTDSSFYDAAFNDIEKDAMILQTITNKAVNGDTKEFFDKVTLMTSADATNPAYGFYAKGSYSDAGRKVTPTDYASEFLYKKKNNVMPYYWLRTSSASHTYYYINQHGTVKSASMTKLGFGIRPVIRVSLNSSAWSYAGRIFSDGTLQKSRVPLLENSVYAAERDNFAPVGTSSIKKLTLDFSNVEGSGVSANALIMTVIKGTTLITKDRVSDVLISDGKAIKCRFREKTGFLKIKLKKDGYVRIFMEDGKKYRISFRVEKPAANIEYKKRTKSVYREQLKCTELFNTTIDGGSLAVVLKKKKGRENTDPAEIASISDNKVIEFKKLYHDKVKVMYKFLNKKYKLPLRI